MVPAVPLYFQFFLEKLYLTLFGGFYDPDQLLVVHLVRPVLTLNY